MDNKKIEEVIKRYVGGESLVSISKNLHMNYSKVRKCLKDQNIQIRSLEKNIINKKFGKLLVIKRINSVDYLCRCECGDEKIYQKNRLSQGNKTSCGSKLCRINKKNYYGYGEICGTYWGIIVTGAKSRNLEISIDAKDAWELYLAQDKKCKITGLLLEMPKSKNNKKMLKLDDFSGPHLASIDRIDSSRGYVKGNIQWVLREINIMKQSMEDDLFINLCKIVVKGQSINEKNSMDI